MDVFDDCINTWKSSFGDAHVVYMCLMTANNYAERAVGVDNESVIASFRDKGQPFWDTAVEILKTNKLPLDAHVEEVYNRISAFYSED